MKPVAAIRDTCHLEFNGKACGRVVYNKSQQLCNAHNLQRLRGEQYRPARERNGITEYMSTDCSVTDCTHPAQSRGLCTSHYWQSTKHGKTSKLYQKRRPKGSVLNRDEQGRKECATCEKWLTEEEFGFSSRSLDNLRRECKVCRAADARRRGANKSRGEKRESWLRRRYGVTPEWFDRTFESQKESCACCGTSNPGPRGWQLDHDHSCCNSVGAETICGKCLRGILCSRCNLTLGVVNDSVELLQKMQDYLRRGTL